MTRHIGVPLDDYEKLVRDQAELKFPLPMRRRQLGMVRRSHEPVQ